MNTKKRKEPPQPSQATQKNGASIPHKRAKVHEARTLRTQPADAALNHGELDLQAFLNAREAEIRALTDGMRASKAVNNRRAFQLVPRGLRRRTASHNVKKLPQRLRARARREQAEDNTPTVEARRRVPKTARARIRVERARALGILAEKKRRRREREAKKAKKGKDGEGEKEKEEQVSAAVKQLIDMRPRRPKIRRNMLNNPLAPKSKFRKRQINKTWLPTHLWHAKRARMTPPKEPLWRFAIPLTPNEKIYRPTHRASTIKGAMVWDMSYMSTIGVYGHEAGIQRTLRAMGLQHESLWDARGTKWREGRRKWSGMLSKQKGDVRRSIGPATVLWNPHETPSPEANEEPTTTSAKTQRQVYIRVHPSCFLEVFDILVKLIKRESPRLYVEDLRFEIGSVELTGPGAMETLLGIIRPYHKKDDDAKEAGARMFESMTVASILPSDAVLGFSAEDPRLCYPPRAVQTKDAPPVQQPTDTASPTPFALFDRNARYAASLFPSQKALNRRKGANPPGKPLEVTSADPAFPLILLSSSSTSTWTMLAPWKCILPLWYSLVHYPLSTGGNPRVGGLDELRQVTFERGLPWFPGDFPGTDAGAEWELAMREQRKSQWAKRPKSKRVAWESLDLGAGRKGEIGAGWACEFERLFDLKGKEKDKEKDAGQQMDVDEDNNTAKSATEKQPPKEPASPHPLTLAHHLSKAAFNSLTANKKSTKTLPPTPPNALVTVKILLPSRGVVSPCARIYRLPSTTTTTAAAAAEVPATNPPPPLSSTTLRTQWLAKLPTAADAATKKKGAPSQQRFPLDADHDTQKLHLARSLMQDHNNKVPFPPPSKTKHREESHIDGHPLVPGEEDLIGFVTKGEFSLAEGRGAAIGCVAADKVVAVGVDGSLAPRGSKGVCVVRNAGEAIGRIGWWEVVG